MQQQLWLNVHQNRYQKGLKIATYGGMNNLGVVSNYMWGFLVAADIFNTIISDRNFPNLFKIKNSILKQVHKMNPTITTLEKIEKVQNIVKNNESWFSQSFEVGHVVKIFQMNYFRVGQSIIFPVSGPQTQNTIDWVKYNILLAILTKIKKLQIKKIKLNFKISIFKNFNCFLSINNQVSQEL
ncbi:hypothetical protein [Spiroplasma endosymbiont of Polydrusus pterygomalis]|uniref:hypothetical protein n=1 Tax=Spiroplasma endosymbiont of Polydrusus pterygomalis TaxID=3139327 RepID=UPI003CCA9A63